MKSLEQATTALECCTSLPPKCSNCAYRGEGGDTVSCAEHMDSDMLYYLKAYQEKSKSWCEEEMRLRKTIDNLFDALYNMREYINGGKNNGG